jgi:integral membrane protein (TIGR01906 family)
MGIPTELNVGSASPYAKATKHIFARSFQIYLTLVVPIALTLLSARLVMTPLFLHLEYSRPGFPDDSYGFVFEDRLDYANLSLKYLFNDNDIGYLRDLIFADNSPLFSQHELNHMEDVKVVTKSAFRILVVGLVITTVMVIGFWKTAYLRFHLKQGLLHGSILAIGMIFSIVVVAIVSWDTFFTDFHEIFFASGTWRFSYSDTLIRLFPEQFWFDAALTIGVLTSLGAILIFMLTWNWKKQAQNTGS